MSLKDDKYKTIPSVIYKNFNTKTEIIFREAIMLIQKQFLQRAILPVPKNVHIIPMVVLISCYRNTLII